MANLLTLIILTLTLASCGGEYPEEPVQDSRVPRPGIFDGGKTQETSPKVQNNNFMVAYHRYSYQGFGMGTVAPKIPAIRKGSAATVKMHEDQVEELSFTFQVPPKNTVNVTFTNGVLSHLEECTQDMCFKMTQPLPGNTLRGLVFLSAFEDGVLGFYEGEMLDPDTQEACYLTIFFHLDPDTDNKDSLIP